jgi:hypothetical protein
MPARRRAPERPRPLPRKDRLIQTRVPRHVEETLKREARRRRVTVSQLIRNLVEDAFQLVDGVVADVDQIVAGSVSLARSVGATARRIARRGAPPAAKPSAPAAAPSEPAAEPSEPGADLSHVYAWSEVVLHRPARCAACGSGIPRGERGFTGLSDEPGAPRVWLCAPCTERLQEVSR